MANPKFIVAAGCSFTEYPQNVRFVNWPGHLATYLNCEPNSRYLGKSSVDNSYIANTTLHTLQKIDQNDYENILLGVVWSGVSRNSFYLREKPVNFGEGLVNPLGFQGKNYYIIGSYWKDELSTNYYKHYYDEVGALINTIKNMLLIQNFCKLNRIRYFFSEYSYDSVSSNPNIADPDVSYLYKLLDKTNFLPVLHMSHWIDNNLDLPYYPNDTHPTPEMSLQFTHQVIIPHLKNMGYID